MDGEVRRGVISTVEGAAFERFWKQRFGDVLPLGHELRKALPRRWLRIHSLPGGKRYAETEAEEATILERHAAIADAVLGEGQSCWLSACVFDHPGELTRDGTITAAKELGLRYAFTHRPPSSADDGQVPVRVLATAIAWNAADFSRWLRAIARDEVRLVWASTTTGAVYAPYDGGGDLILPTVEGRLRVERQFRSWQSDRDDGL